MVSIIFILNCDVVYDGKSGIGKMYFQIMIKLFTVFTLLMSTFLARKKVVKHFVSDIVLMSRI